MGDGADVAHPDAATPAATALGRSEGTQVQQPQTGYNLFREMLKHPSAQPVLARIRDFVVRFPTDISRTDAARRIHAFLSSTQEWMLTESVVFAAEADEEGRTNAAEGLEKFILSQLYSKLFATARDEEVDVCLHKHIAGLQWVEFRHLGVPPVEPTMLQLAVKELRRLDTFKAPRDKLLLILNACRVINEVLKLNRSDAGGIQRPLSADDFLPLLIFCVIQANPPRLNANVEFVATFRHPSRLVAEDAYFLTALQSAIAFARDAGPKVLDITEEEYDRLYEASLALHHGTRPAVDGAASALAADRESRSGLPAPVVQIAEQCGQRIRIEGDAVGGGAEASSVAEKMRQMSPRLRWRLRERAAKLQLRFETVQSSAQLKVDDIPGLLAEYRQLAQLLRAADSEAAGGPELGPAGENGDPDVAG